VWESGIEKEHVDYVRKNNTTGSDIPGNGTESRILEIDTGRAQLNKEAEIERLKWAAEVEQLKEAERCSVALRFR
jgi:hypothetical protein